MRSECCCARKPLRSLDNSDEWVDLVAAVNIAGIFILDLDVDDDLLGGDDGSELRIAFDTLSDPFPLYFRCWKP